MVRSYIVLQHAILYQTILEYDQKIKYYLYDPIYSLKGIHLWSSSTMCNNDILEDQLEAVVCRCPQ